MSAKETVTGSRQLYAVLKESIASGKMQEGDRIPSIRTLAEEYGLNKSTVNTVISMLANEGLIRVETGKGGYVSKTGGMKARPIGVLLLDFSKPTELDMEIIVEIQKNVTADYYLLPTSAARHYEGFLDNLERLIDLGAVGLIVLPPDNPPEDEAQIRRAHALLSRLPVVFINRAVPGFTADMFSMDLCMGMQKALEYFATQGKRNIALIQHNTEKFLREEMCGWREGGKRLGIRQDERFVIPYSEDISFLRERVRAILPEIDGLVGPDKFIQPMQDLFFGMAIPRDLSIVGINDTLITRMFQPQMTALAYPAERISRMAIQKLIGRIERREKQSVTQRSFVPELIIRGT